MKAYLGIDPGLNGGMSVITEEGIETHKMPPTYPDIYELLLEFTNKYGSGNIVAILEDVGQGMPGQSSRATATFAEHIGCLKMGLFALGYRTELVKPQKWMREYSNTIGKSNDCASKTEWKNKLKCEAQRLYPSEKITLWNADSILLAEYGKRKHL